MIFSSSCTSTNYEDNDNEYYSVSVIKPIYDGGEYFKFTLTQTSSFEWCGNEFGSIRAFARIDISNARTGEPIQQIEDIEICESARGFHIFVEDVNFDGFNDIVVNTFRTGTQMRLSSGLWLWSEKSEQFEQHILPAWNAIIDTNEQVVRGSDRVMASQHIWGIYRFIDGEFVLTNIMERGRTLSDDNRWWFAESGKDIVYVYASDGEYPTKEDGNPILQEESIWNPREEDLIFLWNTD